TTLFYMLKPLFLFLTICCSCISVTAQETKTDSIAINVDSVEKEIDAFLNLYDSLKAPRSYFLLSIGAGNTQFSVRNVALNAQQSATNLNITPIVGYYHKSGLGITYNNYMLVEAGKTELLQHALTLSYDYLKGEHASYGISYTRFFGKKEFVNAASPYDNDLLLYVQFGKRKFQPGAMLGFSGGRYRETLQYLDSQQVRMPLTNQFVTQYYYVSDTSNVLIRDVSLIPYLRYNLMLAGIGEKDYFNLQPTLMLLGSSGKVAIDSKGTIRQRRLLDRSRNYSETYSQKSTFQFQSVGLQLDATWYIGKFFLNPQVYFDYYLLSGENKWSALYSVQTGLMF
ncbi:MAG: hypothetical protein KA160_05790, partial [Lacibacter sp.]|nr:hypothetical protein [Lacibacter sp.]